MAVIMEFKNFMRSVVDPCWVDPKPWSWHTQEGEKQGIAILADQPGIFNLCWLALSLDEPPKIANLRDNVLLLWVIMEAAKTPLNQFAAVHTLRQFAALESTDRNVAALIVSAGRKVGR